MTPLPSPAPPLTHHEILAMVEPFTRRGRHVDLQASDRMERRLAFRERQHAVAGALPALREGLWLENPRPGRFRLLRTLTAADGLQAELLAEGPDPTVLLDLVDAVPPDRQFRHGGGASTAYHHRVTVAQLADSPTPVPPLALQQAEARLPGLVLRMRVSPVRGYPAELELRRADAAPPAGHGAVLSVAATASPASATRADAADAAAPAAMAPFPNDLLAVLGRPWGRLMALRGAWSSSVQLHPREPERSHDAETRLQLTVEHLMRTLAEPPARFHERHWRARWGVALRRTIPLSIGLAVAAVALLVRRQGPGAESVLALLANVAPPLLLGLFFLQREMPRIELLRVPRRPRGHAWLAAPPPMR